MNAELRAGEPEGTATSLLRRSALVIGLRGLLAIVLGIVALRRPAATWSAFVMILAIYLICDGLLTLASTFYAAARGRTWWPYLLEGLVSFTIGLIGLARPNTFTAIVLVLVALRSIVVGIAELGTGLSVRRTIGAPAVLLVLGGLASFAFGVVLLTGPGVGLFALIWVFGVYAIAFGVILDGVALKARSAASRLEQRPA
jgi:uncharacterized membrane protein HdeD (DUF308 family)